MSSGSFLSNILFLVQNPSTRPRFPLKGNKATSLDGFLRKCSLLPDYLIFLPLPPPEGDSLRLLFPDP